MRPRRRTTPIVNLGDIVGYGASPNEVTARVRALGEGATPETLVRGNHDKVVAGLDNVETFNPMAGMAALWNRAQLTQENLEWLRALPQGPVTLPECSQRPVRARRARRRRPLRGPDSGRAAHAGRFRRDHHVLRTHPHSRSVSVLRNGFAESAHPEYTSIGQSETCEFQLETGVSYMINPGSVGQPRDGDWRSGFALFDTDRRVMTFCRCALRPARGAGEDFCRESPRPAGDAAGGGTVMPMRPTPENYLIAHTDGGARGNPGPAGYGVAISDAKGNKVAGLSKYLGHQTNNFAEYQALIGALEYAVENGTQGAESNQRLRAHGPPDQGRL